jgi:hypothetical protein
MKRRARAVCCRARGTRGGTSSMAADVPSFEEIHFVVPRGTPSEDQARPARRGRARRSRREARDRGGPHGSRRPAEPRGRRARPARPDAPAPAAGPCRVARRRLLPSTRRRCRPDAPGPSSSTSGRPRRRWSCSARFGSATPCGTATSTRSMATATSTSSSNRRPRSGRGPPTAARTSSSPGAATTAPTSRCDLLQKHLGVRWLFPGELGTVSPRPRASPTSGLVNEFEEPAVRSRTLAGLSSNSTHTAAELDEIRAWQLRNRLRPHNDLAKLFQRVHGDAGACVPAFAARRLHRGDARGRGARAHRPHAPHLPLPVQGPLRRGRRSFARGEGRPSSTTRSCATATLPKVGRHAQRDPYGATPRLHIAPRARSGDTVVFARQVAPAWCRPAPAARPRPHATARTHA